MLLDHYIVVEGDVRICLFYLRDMMIVSVAPYLIISIYSEVVLLIFMSNISESKGIHADYVVS